jgi:hypothetical protein
VSNHTRRVKSHSSCGSRTLRVEIILVRVEINLARVEIADRFFNFLGGGGGVIIHL